MARNQSKEQAASGPSAQPAGTAFPTTIAVRIHKINPTGNPRATASVNLNGVFAVHGLKVMDGKKGLFVSMPGYQGRSGWVDSVHPIDAGFREQLNQAVMDAYAQAITQGQSDLMAAQQRAATPPLPEETPGMQMSGM